MNYKTFSRIIKISCIILIFLSGITFGDIKILRAFPNLQFDSPIEIVTSPGKPDRIFIVSQKGIIYQFENNDNSSDPVIFLDIRTKVLFGGEQGLLGLAFHPAFTDNGYFYVNYTTSDPRRTIISRFTLSSANNDIADPESELILLEYNQPYSNHNGGKIAFGPDGFLYISAGDGGSGGDPQNNAQNLSSLLGKILRIDVDVFENGNNYGIPDNNPFKDNNENFAEEIYAYGLRNVWKFSFDSSGRLWAADVGQNAWEEISLIENGGNYGWRIMEGNHCYNPSLNCDQSGLELPVWEYPHNSQGGYSITGGYVYEGSLMPSLTGKYIYGDFITGNIWAFDPANGTNEFISKFNGDISTFGLDAGNNIYFASYSSGFIYKIIDDNVSDVETIVQPEFYLMQNYPNPFNPATKIQYYIPVAVPSPDYAGIEGPLVTLKVYDILGREVATLVNENQKPGTYTIEFNASSSGRELSSGIYYYKLTTDRFSETKKMLLLR